MLQRGVRISRRTLLRAAGSTLALASLPRAVVAQAAPIKLGTLTPLTGAGGSYGPSMRKAMEFVAQEVNADLIVMGTHGRTGLAHIFFGSVAEYVVRHSHLPVLTVRQEER